MKRFIVVQASTSGAWRHYLAAWERGVSRVQSQTTQPNDAIQEAKRRARAELNKMHASKQGQSFLERHSTSSDIPRQANTMAQDVAKDPRARPVWHADCGHALRLDEQSARLLVDQLDTLYRQAEAVHHMIEELL